MHLNKIPISYKNGQFFENKNRISYLRGARIARGKRFFNATFRMQVVDWNFC